MQNSLPRAINVRLPFSKSISNRLLLLRAFSKGKVTIEGLSDATDTVRLQRLLEERHDELNAVDGGTTFRFLLPYLVLTGRDCTLTGNERLNLRPVRELVDALRSIGADIGYEADEGFPPLRIRPSEITGGMITVDTSRSSQFASALVLAAPFVPGGLTIRLVGSRVSDSYFEMTLRLLSEAGVRFTIDDGLIRIPQQQLPASTIKVEPDWSSAAFWYQLVCLRPEVTLLLKGLRLGSLQGDETVSVHFGRLGVRTSQLPEGVLITGTMDLPVTAPLQFDLLSTPDLAPALVVACFVRKVPAVFTGIGHLKFKESDRMQVLEDLLTAMGGVISYDADRFEIRSFPDRNRSMTIDPHNDHRIAMAFAIAGCVMEGIKVSNPEVVDKSYPEFWKQLAVCGLNATAT